METGESASESRLVILEVQSMDGDKTAWALGNELAAE
jgi:hypothetical protein